MVRLTPKRTMSIKQHSKKQRSTNFKEAKQTQSKVTKEICCCELQHVTNEERTESSIYNSNLRRDVGS